MKASAPIGFSQPWQVKQSSCHAAPSYSNILDPAREEEEYRQMFVIVCWYLLLTFKELCVTIFDLCPTISRKRNLRLRRPKVMIQSDGSTCSYTALLEYQIMSAYLASKQSDKLQQSNTRADLHMSACTAFSETHASLQRFIKARSRLCSWIGHQIL